METEISFAHVGAFRGLVDYLQVHPAVGLDHGVSGGKAGHVCVADMGKEICRVW